MSGVNFTARRGLSLLGDEVGAWMADTTAETLVGSELVTNGTFDTVTTGWTATNSATLSIVSGKLRVAYNGATNPYARQQITTVVGETYQIVADGEYSSKEFLIGVGTTPGGIDIYSSGSKAATEAGILGSFVATGTAAYLMLLTVATSAGYADFDNVSVRLAVPDLSTANNGLGVYGSITKTAVATGADLVAYSGFSTSNYLEQPYNSDLDFGTGDFCFSGWLKLDTTSSTNIICVRSNYGITGSIIQLYLTSTGVVTFRISDDGLVSNDNIVSPSTYEDGEFYQVFAVRSGSNLLLYIDGVVVVTGAVSNAAGSLSQSDAVLRQGINADDTSPASETTLALCRVFDYAPTAAQIKAIYDKEKHLFKKYSYYTQEGESYDLNIQQMTPRPGSETTKATTKTISGKERSIVHHENDTWEIQTSLIHRTDGTTYLRKSEFAELMYSTNGSESFTYDPYGSIASPDEPLTVQRTSNQYQFAPEENTEFFRASFTVREVNE